MHDAGSALMGIGRASGENRAVEAAKQAIASPLLEVNITGAQGILFNISGSSNLTLYEVTEAAEEIRAAADPEANIIFGASFDERLGEDVVITVIATGLRRHAPPRDRSAARPPSARTRSPAGPSRARLPRRAGAPAQRRGRRRAPGWSGRPTDRAEPVSVRAERTVRGDRAGRERAPDATTRTTWRSRASSAAPSSAGPCPTRRAYPAAAGPPDPAAVARSRRCARRASWRAIARGLRAFGRDPAGVTLVAVSKTVDAERLRAAVAAGLTILGENRVQEADAKVAARARGRLAPRRAAPGQQGAPRGRDLRRHRERRLGGPRGAPRPDRRRARPGRPLPILLQVNVDADPAKAGFEPDGLAAGAAGARRRCRTSSCGAS